MTGAMALLNLLAGLFVLWGLWYYGLRSHLLDRFRIRLRQIEGSLEDAKADPDIPTDSPEFETLNSISKGLRTHAEHMNVLTVVIGGIFTGFKTEVESEEEVARLENLLRGEQGEELKALTERLLQKMGLFLPLLSPSLWIPFGILFVIQFVRAIGVLSSAIWSTALGVVNEAIKHPRLAGAMFRVRGRA